jgi:hypothetical protein
MSNFVDLTGQRFGRLTVIALIQKASRKNNRTKYQCRCDCGNMLIVESDHLKRGHTQSCGCYKKEHISTANKTHGISNHRLCSIWHGIKRRCYCEKATGYENYGGRGITMCAEWRDNIHAFYDWALFHGYSDDLSIDRIDNNRGYSPDNCRWATKKEQQRNNRRNYLLTIAGETKCLSEWLDQTGVAFKTAQKRLLLGWQPDQAVGLQQRVNGGTK